MIEEFTPERLEQDLALSIGEDALSRIGTTGLHALAVAMNSEEEFELIIVSDQPVTLQDVLRWEHHTGELNLVFNGQAHIELRIMDPTEFHALSTAEEPHFNRALADA